MRKDIWAAALGFLIGAAAIAGGQDADDLRDELRRLQREVARAAQKNWETRDLPPADGSGRQLAIFPLDDLAAPRHDRIPPSGGFVDENSEAPLFGGIAEEGLLPFGTREEIVEALWDHLGREHQDRGEVVGLSGDSVVVLHYPATIGRMREVLDRKWRPVAHAGVAVDFEVVDVPAAVARSVARGGRPLTNADRTALAEAAAGEGGARVLTLRGAGLLGSRFHVWHGRQVALVIDADVEVAQTASVADPVVEVAQAGGLLSVRASRGASDGELQLDLRVRLRGLEKVERQETDQAGVLDAPTLSDQDSRLLLRVPAGAWVVAGGGTLRRGVERLFLVKAAPLARGEVR